MVSSDVRVGCGRLQLLALDGTLLTAGALVGRLHLFVMMKSTTKMMACLTGCRRGQRKLCEHAGRCSDTVREPVQRIGRVRVRVGPRIPVEACAHRVRPLVGAVQRLNGLFAVLRDLPAEEQTLLQRSHGGLCCGKVRSVAIRATLVVSAIFCCAVTVLFGSVRGCVTSGRYLRVRRLLQ